MLLLYRLYLSHLTLCVLLAVPVSMAIPYFVFRRRNLHAGMCCFVVAWQLLVWDAVRQLINLLGSLGAYQAWMVPVEEYWFGLIEPLLFLTVPLVFLCVSLMFSNEEEHQRSRSTRLLVLSCCLCLADLILLIIFLGILMLPFSLVDRIFLGLDR